ncbi:MAG: M48 family metallopeptidase, partial [Armatimonadota bacterium]
AQDKIINFNVNANGRILAIGLPILGGLTINELRAVLSHEFAHFSGKDTKYSSTVLPVYAGTSTAWISMEEGLAAQSRTHDSALIHYATILPMMLPKYMLIAYLNLFHLLNMKISRTRECRADAIAANTCGSKCCEKALLKVYALCDLFADSESDNVIRQTANTQGINNRYRAFRLALPQLSARASTLAKQAYAQIQGKHDSHPSLKNRVQAMGNVPDQFSDKDQCTILFANLESYENTLHDQMTALMAQIERD